VRRMINRFLHFSLVFSLVFLPLAARSADKCAVQYEMRMDLKDPDGGSYNLWDTVYGDSQKEQVFKSGFPAVLPMAQMVVAGEEYVQDRDEKDLLFGQIGKNGRVIMTAIRPLEGLQNLVKILPYGDKMLVFANVRRQEGPDGKAHNGIWLGHFDMKGNMISEKEVSDPKADLVLFDVIPSRVAGEYLLAATIKKKSLQQPISAILYRMKADGSLLSDHAFVTGTENRIMGLDVLAGNGYIATGFSYGEDGRKNGWIARLNNDLGIVWQNVYPRGMGAELVAGQSMLNNTIAVVGHSAPAGDGALAGWVMVVDADSGTVGWQRFFSGSLHFMGRDIAVSEDGLISVLLDGDVPSGAKDSEGKDLISHIRLLTLTPQGGLFSSDAFTNGAGVDAFHIMTGLAGERLVLGSSKILYKIEKPVVPEKGSKPEQDVVDMVPSHDGWIVAFPLSEPYKDPCVQPLGFLP